MGAPISPPRPQPVTPPPPRSRSHAPVGGAAAAPPPSMMPPQPRPQPMTRDTTCQSTSGSPDPARILHHPPLSGDHQPVCAWGAILQIEEASNFRWRRPQPAAGRAPWTCVAGILRHARHLLSVGVKSIFFRAVESTLTLIRSAAAPRVLPKQP